MNYVVEHLERDQTLGYLWQQRYQGSGSGNVAVTAGCVRNQR